MTTIELDLETDETLQRVRQTRDASMVTASALEFWVEHQNGFDPNPQDLLARIAGPLARLCSEGPLTLKQVEAIKALQAVAAKPVGFDEGYQ